VLAIEGSSIQSVSLVAEDRGNRPILLRRGRATLPPGRYRVQSVELEGGYRAILYEKPEQFTLAPDRPYVFRAGAPLTARVEAVRQGRMLELNYKLTDVAGRSYAPQALTPAGRSTAPQFTILRDGQSIHSGAFEYG
jgi:hypothetical protein